MVRARDASGLLSIGIAALLLVPVLPTAFSPTTASRVALANVVATHALPGPYVLKADVEGAELHVLARASAVLAQTELVLLEVERLYGGIPDEPVVLAPAALAATRPPVRAPAALVAQP